MYIFMTWGRSSRDIAANKVVVHLQTRMFGFLETLSPSYFARKQAGEVIQEIMEDSERAASLYVRVLWDFLGGLIISVALIVFFGLLDDENKMVFLACLLSIVFLQIAGSYWISKGLVSFHKGARHKALQASDAVAEAIDNIDELRTHNTLDYHKDQFRNYLLQRSEMIISAAQKRQRMDIIIKLVNVGCLLVLILVAASFLETKVVSIWAIIVLNTQLINIPAVFQDLALSRVSVENCAVFLETPRPITNAQGNLHPGEIDDFTVRFNNAIVRGHGTEPILSNATLEAMPGSKVGLHGPSGSGKSTTLGLLNWSQQCSDGNVSVGDISISRLAPAHLAQHMGFVPQTSRIFSGTVFFNMVYGLLCPPRSTDSLEIEQVTIRCPKKSANENVLDRILSEARAVGLEEDLFYWGLSTRLALDPESASDTSPRIGQPSQALTELLATIRTEVLEALRNEKLAFTAFPTTPQDAYFPNLSIAENMLEGVYDSNCDQFKDFYRKLVDLCMGKTIENHLLAIGIAQYDSPEGEAMRIALDNRTITDLLKSRKRELDVARSLLIHGRLDHNEQQRMSLHLRTALVTIALFCVPPECLGEIQRDQLFQDTVVGMRKTVADAGLKAQARGFVEAWEKKQFFTGLSLRENLAFGRFDPRRPPNIKRGDDIIKQILCQLKGNPTLLDHIRLLGLCFEVGTHGMRLSLGQQRKIVIARNLLKDPTLLLLDEPLANLDRDAADRIMQTLDERFEPDNHIRITASHDVNSVRNCERLYYISRGVIEPLASPEALNKTENLSQGIFNKEDIEALYSHGMEVIYHENERIFEEGTEGNSAYFIVDGEVVITQQYREDNQVKERTLRTMGKGELFGEIALLMDNSLRTTTVTALKTTTMREIAREPFHEMLGNHPSFVKTLLRIQTNRLREKEALLNAK